SSHYHTNSIVFPYTTLFRSHDSWPTVTIAGSSRRFKQLTRMAATDTLTMRLTLKLLVCHTGCSSGARNFGPVIVETKVAAVAGTGEARQSGSTSLLRGGGRRRS